MYCDRNDYTGKALPSEVSWSAKDEAQARESRAETNANVSSNMQPHSSVRERPYSDRSPSASRLQLVTPPVNLAVSRQSLDGPNESGRLLGLGMSWCAENDSSSRFWPTRYGASDMVMTRSRNVICSRWGCVPLSFLLGCYKIRRATQASYEFDPHASAFRIAFCTTCLSDSGSP